MQSRARVLYFAIFLSLLGGIQAGAQLLQFRGGFRPLSHPPSRVPYSWDMFAIRLDRCVVGWDPPLEIEGQPVARWSDREPAPIEFDTIFNDADWYGAAASRGCSFRTAAPTVARLKCFSSDGKVHEYGLACP